MKNIALTLVTIIILSGNIVNLHSADFWVKYHSMTDEMIDVATYNQTHPAYITKDNRLFIGTSTELTIPDKVTLFNSVVHCKNDPYYELFRILTGSNNSGVYKYDSDKMNWTEFNNNLTDTNVIIIYSDEEYVFAKTSDKKLWRTKSDTCKWELMQSGLDELEVISVFQRGTYREIMGKYNYIAGTIGNGTYGWNSDSLKWEPFNRGIQNETVIGTFVGKDLYNGFFPSLGAFWAATHNGMFKLEEVNEPEQYKWTPYNFGLENLSITSLSGLEIGSAIIDIIPDSFPVILPWSLFLTTEDGCFYYEKYHPDYGTEWVKDTSGLQGNYINKINSMSVFFNHHKIFAATTNGIYTINTDRIYTGKADTHLNYSLSISPNPATETTNITFELESDSPVSISVTDILGNEVAELLSNEYYSSGKHSVQFNTGNLSAGIYFCTMKAGSRIETSKIVVVE